MAPLSDFQKKKLEALYNMFYDVNHDGQVDWNDFQACIEKFAKLNGWNEDNEKKKLALESLQFIWDNLKKLADKNNDNVVSHEEWLSLWAECAENILTKQEFPYWLSAYMGFMFDSADTSGDNVIDKEEYRKAYTEFGVAADQCDASYDKFTDSGKNALNRELYSRLWHEYFLSDDKAAKGNALFGTPEW